MQHIAGLPLASVESCPLQHPLPAHRARHVSSSQNQAIGQSRRCLIPSIRRSRSCARVLRASCAGVSGVSSEKEVVVARPGEFAPLRIGSLVVDPPVILAPMAGVTNAAYRALCQSYGAPMCVSEMVTAGTLLTRHWQAMQIVSFGPCEAVRSAQLYGVRPDQVRQAATMLAGELGAQHIDLNFGCPVKKVTAKGGGSAIPVHPTLLASLVRAAVQGVEAAGCAGAVPVTVKMRVGISEDLPTYLEAGRASEGEGAAAVSLHARNADQLYSPPVRWNAIAELADHLQIPVIGNGDIFEAEDAVRMMRTTGAAGVMIGRGSLGRPWLFRDLCRVFSGLDSHPQPALQEVVEVATSHCEALVAFYGSEKTALRSMRKMVPLYLYGFESGVLLRNKWLQSNTMDEWRTAIHEGSFDCSEPFPIHGLRYARLKTGAAGQTQRVALPDGWLAARDTVGVPVPEDVEACEG